MLVISIIIVMVLAAGAYLFLTYRPSGLRAAQVFAWIGIPASSGSGRSRLAAGVALRRSFFRPPVLPDSSGTISFRLGHRHQGVDIFAGTEINVTPVIAAYPGYLTRLPEWKSSVIVRVPNDPLVPGRQIWVYYTHMADPNGNSFISS